MAVKKKKAVRKKPTPRAPQKITIKEFQSWVSGVLEFQDKDWTPNAEQWKTILLKCNKLANDETVEEVASRVVDVTMDTMVDRVLDGMQDIMDAQPVQQVQTVRQHAQSAFNQPHAQVQHHSVPVTNEPVNTAPVTSDIPLSEIPAHILGDVMGDTGVPAPQPATIDGKPPVNDAKPYTSGFD